MLLLTFSVLVTNSNFFFYTVTNPVPGVAAIPQHLTTFPTTACRGSRGQVLGIFEHESKKD